MNISSWEDCPIGRHWDLASAWIYQWLFRWQFLELWDSTKCSWAIRSAFGVWRNPFAKQKASNSKSQPLVLWSSCQFWLGFLPPKFPGSLYGPILSALLSAAVLGSLCCWAVTAGWSECCPISFWAQQPPPDLVLSLLLPNLWSPCSWTPSLCCLIAFLSNQPDGRFDSLLLPLTLLLPAGPWPARSSPAIPSDPPLVPLADQLYFFSPQQFPDPLLRPSTCASDQLPDTSSFGVLFDLLAVHQTSLEFYSRNCAFFTLSLTLPLGLPR